MCALLFLTVSIYIGIKLCVGWYTGYLSWYVDFMFLRSCFAHADCSINFLVLSQLVVVHWVNLLEIFGVFLFGCSSEIRPCVKPAEGRKMSCFLRPDTDSDRVAFVSWVMTLLANISNSVFKDKY